MANMANDHKCQNIDISAVEDGHHRTVVVVLCHLNLVSYVCCPRLFLFEDWRCLMADGSCHWIEFIICGLCLGQIVELVRMSAEAVIVAGEASESDEEGILHLSTATR